MVLSPATYRRFAPIFSRLKTRSRLRRALLRWAVVSGWAAFSRGDIELMLIRYAPDVEFTFAPGLQTLGLKGTYRGHDQMRAGLRELVEDWNPMEMEPSFVVDTGEVVVNLGFIHARGRTSGARVDTEIAQVLTVRAGLAAIDHAWDTWRDGLRAAGLDPDAVSLPRPRSDQPSNQA